MATLIQLCQQNQLLQLDPQLSSAALEERFVFLLPRVRQWFEDELPSLQPTWNRELSPLEQIDALMEIFCSGQPLAIGQTFKHLFFRDAAGIWELKTADVRIFGWFPWKDHFIASAAGLADHIKTHNLYHGYSVQAQRDRDLLNLDKPKFIFGDNPNDVVSNWHKP